MGGVSLYCTRPLPSTQRYIVACAVPTVSSKAAARTLNAIPCTVTCHGLQFLLSACITFQKLHQIVQVDDRHHWNTKLLAQLPAPPTCLRCRAPCGPARSPLRPVRRPHGGSTPPTRAPRSPAEITSSTISTPALPVSRDHRTARVVLWPSLRCTQTARFYPSRQRNRNARRQRNTLVAGPNSTSNAIPSRRWLSR